MMIIMIITYNSCKALSLRLQVNSLRYRYTSK